MIQELLNCHYDCPKQYNLRQFSLTRFQVCTQAPSEIEHARVLASVYISPNTFTAEDARIYSNAELNNFWNRVLFTKHSDTTLKLLKKAISSASSAMYPENDRSSRKHDNPYNLLRIGLHDQLLKLAPLFAPDWFADALIVLFGFPCYILTE